MSFVADTHVHLYPCYDLDRAFRTLVANLSHLAGRHRPGADLVAMLTERHDCHFFKALSSGTLHLPPDISVVPTAEDEALSVTIGETVLTLVAGRQIVSSERVEILALSTDAEIEDGQPAGDVIRRVQEVGGIPVLSWAPGKWMFKREGVIRELFRRLNPGEVLAGDTTLRPIGWREPALMSEARRRGIGVVAGSDPLPFAGEEASMGSYATARDFEMDPEAPASSLRTALKAPGAAVLLGARCTLIPWLTRLRRNAKAPKPSVA